MDDDLSVVVLLVHHVLKERLDFVDVLLGSIHLAKAVADLMLEKLGGVLLVEGSDESIHRLDSLERLDAEQGVYSISDGGCRV